MQFPDRFGRIQCLHLRGFELGFGRSVAANRRIQASVEGGTSTQIYRVPINAIAGHVKSDQNHMSGNATNQELACGESSEQQPDTGSQRHSCRAPERDTYCAYSYHCAAGVCSQSSQKREEGQ